MVELREGRILGATPDPTGGPNQGQACVRGRFLIKEAVHHRTRILKPMVRKDGRLGEVSWDEAIATVAERLAGIGPGEVGVAASGHSSCEDLFVLNKFATDVLGARIIAGPWTASVAGILEQLGRATGQDIPLNFRIPDIGRAEVILSFAADLSVTQPIVRLEILRAARSGATVVTPGEHGLTLKSSGVVFFLAALSKILLESGKAPAAGAAGSGPFLASLKAFNLERALSALAISKEKMMEIAQAVKTRKPGVLLLEPGILRLADAAGSLAAAWNLAVLADLRIVPLDGLANIRGGLAIARAFSAQPVTAEDLAAAAASKKIRGLYLAGPFPSASPAAEFVIVQDAYLGETAAVADVVFPETTGLESLGTFVNIEGRIQQADQAIKPRGEAKPGWRLLADLAIKMGATDFGYTSTDSVRHDLIHRVPAFRHLPGTADPSDDLFLQERPATPGAFVDVKTAAGVVEDRLASTPSDPDSYKGLNMARETKSLKLLRGRHV